ncbi:hypothetical protein M0208_11415 [Sphingomonas sp. SUN019]|uniref:hypothetical protein n=1 Tax=Sphingomonas sp. SUN019 TaxID=2937788 RepID=UPI002164807A|nr:hypothetical protein [Sphingomonas sp. SUN019]UVO51097.1 hypothetical protein M0208_11415 [Sphingomonas sp. SUN019]
MDQQPNYRRRRIAFAAAAIALLALTNRPDPTPMIGVIEIAASDEEPPRMKAEAAPLIAGAATLASWAAEHIMR